MKIETLNKSHASGAFRLAVFCALLAAFLPVGRAFAFYTNITTGGNPVVAWGNNMSGQINVPSEMQNIISVAGGAGHSLALSSYGTIVAWGTNDLGQCNVPIQATDVASIAAGSDHSLALRRNGTVVAWGANAKSQCTVPSDLVNVMAIAAGDAFSMALLSNGTVVAWGDNSLGQTAIPSGLNNVIAISAFDRHCLALKSDGTVAAWGWNDYNQCRVPAGLSGIKAVAAGSIHSLALRNDGTVVAWGGRIYEATTVPQGLGNVVQIAAGWFHSLARKSDGSVVAWGADFFGQTDVPSLTGPATFVAAGGNHSLAVISLFVPMAPFITYQSTNQTVPENGSVYLYVSASGTMPLQYQWYFNNAPIGDANNDYFYISEAQNTAAGDYKVVVNNSYGSTTSAVIRVTVTNQPSLPIIFVQPVSVSTILGSNAIFSVTASSTTSLGYQWRFNAADILGATGQNLTIPDVQPASLGGYSVVVSNPSGSVTSQVATLSVPTVTIFDSFNMDGTQNNPSTDPTFQLTTTTLITSIYNYHYNNGSGAAPGFIGLKRVTNGVPTDMVGEWQAVGSDAYGNVNNGNWTVFPNVVLPPGVYVVTDSSHATWSYTTTSYYGAGGPNWAPGVGFSRIAGVAIPPSGLTITFQSSNITAQAGALVELYVVASGADPISYQWYFGMTPLINATNYYYEITNFTNVDEGSYFVIASNSQGSVTSAVMTLNIYTPGESPQISEPPSGMTFVAGDLAYLSVSAYGAEPLSYQWLKNGIPLVNDARISGAQSNMLYIANTQPSDVGYYTVTVSNRFGVMTSSPPAPIDFFVTIPDQNLDSAVRNAIDKPFGYLRSGDLLSLTALNLYESSIADLSGLEWARNLSTAYFRYDYFSDLTPLLDLPNLKELGIAYNSSITNLQAIAGLTNLNILALIGLELTDAAWMTQMVHLTSLDLSDNLLTNAPVLMNLTDLSVENNQIAELSSLVPLPELNWLAIGGNPVTNFSALASMTNLSGLSAPMTGFTNLAPLAGLTNLTTLILSANELSDLRPLKGLIQLKYLGLENNSISDLAPLADMAVLSELYLQWNNISDISPIGGLPGLTTVDITYNLLDTSSNSTTMVTVSNWTNRLITVAYEPQTETALSILSVSVTSPAYVNTPVTLFVNAASGYPLSYQWFKNGIRLDDNGRISGSQSNTLYFQYAQFEDSGDYTVVVSNTHGSATNDPPAYLQVDNSPIPQAASITSALWANNQFTLTFQAQPDVNYTVQKTTNFLIWTSVRTFSKTNGVVTYTDTSSTDDHAFYRIQEEASQIALP